MPGDGVIGGAGLDAFATVMIVVPVQQYGSEAGQQALADGRGTLCGGFRFQGAQRGAAGAQHIHGFGRGGQPLENFLQCGREAAQLLEAALISAQGGPVRQGAMD